MTDRKLPEGLSTFEEIRRGGYLYVDKTDIVWKIVNGTKFNYLSRPRRFGKSILIDTLQCYFEGKKELFEGLKIMEMEKEWKSYPVIHLDMSVAGATAEGIRSYFNFAFRKLERKYNVDVYPEDTLGTRFQNIIETASNFGENPAVVLIDEYDSPLLGSWKTDEHEACTSVYREVFAILKSASKYEKLVFITGITKFTQLSLFSVLNKLSNISFDKDVAAVCGITDDELHRIFKPEIERMAHLNGLPLEMMGDRLKSYYDGYHFSPDNMVGIYNPFSVITAMSKGKLGNYWAASGATKLISKFVTDMDMMVEKFDDCLVMRDLLETSDVTGGSAALFMFQSGYLTIKDFNSTSYTLGYPNEEVRRSLYEIVLPALTMKGSDEILTLQAVLEKAMRHRNLQEAMKTLKSLIADVPYSNIKLASMKMEERYRLIISSIFHAIGLRVEVERMISTGRIDMVVYTSKYIYVIELKLINNGGINAAEQQMIHNQYTAPFEADGRQVVSLVIELDDMGKGMSDWKEI